MNDNMTDIIDEEWDLPDYEKIVHHKNHKRDDNRIENLQLVSDDRHNQITILEVRIKYLESLLREAHVNF